MRLGGAGWSAAGNLPPIQGGAGEPQGTLSARKRNVACYAACMAKQPGGCEAMSEFNPKCALGTGRTGERGVKMVRNVTTKALGRAAEDYRR